MSVVFKYLLLFKLSFIFCSRLFFSGLSVSVIYSLLCFSSCRLSSRIVKKIIVVFYVVSVSFPVVSSVSMVHLFIFFLVCRFQVSLLFTLLSFPFRRGLLSFFIVCRFPNSRCFSSCRSLFWVVCFFSSCVNFCHLWFFSIYYTSAALLSLSFFFIQHS